jgi:hypothetical protein
MLTAGAAAAALAAGVWGAAALAQVAGTPPPWDTLVRCAQMADQDARLACYDTAMRAAGYTPKPEEVEADKHRRFGLTIPQVNVLKHKDQEEGAQAAGQPTPQEEKEAKKQAKQAAKEAKKQAKAAEQTEDEITVELSQIARVQPTDRLIMFTSDGQIWEQVDTDQVQSPSPGDQMTIHKGKLGGYLCDVTPYKAVRCKRDR